MTRLCRKSRTLWIENQQKWFEKLIKCKIEVHNIEAVLDEKLCDQYEIHLFSDLDSIAKIVYEDKDIKDKSIKFLKRVKRVYLRGDAEISNLRSFHEVLKMRIIKL